MSCVFFYCESHKKRNELKKERSEILLLEFKVTSCGICCILGGKSESQRQQLPAEGRLLQAGAEGLAGLQRGGEEADQQAAGQVGQRDELNQTP